MSKDILYTLLLWGKHGEAADFEKILDAKEKAEAELAEAKGELDRLREALKELDKLSKEE